MEDKAHPEENNRQSYREAYLDIETTGLSPRDCEITVVGLLVDGCYYGLVNGFDLTPEALLYVLDNVDVIYTFNGRRFDIPFIEKRMCFNPKDVNIGHIDMLYECRRVGLRGGQKIVEKILGLSRGQECVDGRAAAGFGKKWLRHGDLEALDILLRYNEDDLRNLMAIKTNVDRMRAVAESAESH